MDDDSSKARLSLEKSKSVKVIRERVYIYKKICSTFLFFLFFVFLKAIYQKTAYQHLFHNILLFIF